MISNNKTSLLTTTLTIVGLCLTLLVSYGAPSSSSKKPAPSAKKGTTSQGKASAKPAGDAATKEQPAAKKAAEKASATLTTTQKSKMLALINKGTPDELVAIHGIGQSRATALAKARPFTSVDQLAGVKGIGVSVFTDLITHAKSLTQRRSSSSPTSGKKPPSGSGSRSGSRSGKRSGSRSGKRSGS
jgi:DNA uptake protein ComE-like DNA-binding protein